MHLKELNVFILLYYVFWQFRSSISSKKKTMILTLNSLPNLRSSSSWDLCWTEAAERERGTTRTEQPQLNVRTVLTPPEDGGGGLLPLLLFPSGGPDRLSVRSLAAAFRISFTVWDKQTLTSDILTICQRSVLSQCAGSDEELSVSHQFSHWSIYSDTQLSSHKHWK